VLQVDEMVAFGTDIMDLIMFTFSLDPASKMAKRAELTAGPLKSKLEKLALLLESAGGKFFLGGEKPTLAE
jgi:hypothetical protein